MNRKLLVMLISMHATLSLGSAQTTPYKLGRPATTEEIRKRSISVAPDGTGLPVGHGTAAEGRYLYNVLCASCHGERGQGVGDYPALVGGQGTLHGQDPVMTVGSYWPYATTVWDYTRRAMPYQRPGTLTPDETYAVTAYLLYLNEIVDEKIELNEKSLPKVKMPNRDGFVSDPRPDTPAKQSLPGRTARCQATERVTLTETDLSPKFLGLYDEAVKEQASPDERWQLWKKMYHFRAVPPPPRGEKMARTLFDQGWPRYPSVLEGIRVERLPSGRQLTNN